MATSGAQRSLEAAEEIVERVMALMDANDFDGLMSFALTITTNLVGAETEIKALRARITARLSASPLRTIPASAACSGDSAVASPSARRLTRDSTSRNARSPFWLVESQPFPGSSAPRRW